MDDDCREYLRTWQAALQRIAGSIGRKAFPLSPTFFG